jgi:hypothetical protein
MLKSIESSALGTLKHTCKQAPWLVEFIETRLGVDYAGIVSYTRKLWMGLKKKAAYLPGC